MTMVEPFRLSLGKRITDAIKTITPANGFTHDLSDFVADDGVASQRVFRGRAWFGDTDPVPMVSVLENPNAAEDLAQIPVDSTTGEFDWHLLIQGFVNDDPAHPTDPAYLLEQEVRTVLGREKRRRKLNGNGTDPFQVSQWKPDGCGIFDMTIGIGVIRPADDVSAKAYFWLPLSFRLIESLEGA